MSEYQHFIKLLVFTLFLGVIPISIVGQEYEPRNGDKVRLTPAQHVKGTNSA